MKCEMCGQNYGVAHSCAGIAAAADVSDVAPPPEGFALGHYLGEACRIATWDDAAIRRTMNDPNAIPYGVVIYVFAISLQLALPVIRFLIAGRYEHAIIIAASVPILILASAVLDLIRIGICHLLSKWFAPGTGKLKQLLGPLLLGSIVYVFTPVPFLGIFVTGLAWIAVFVMVFQEVHGIEPLTAFLFSAGVGVAFFLVQLYALPIHHR
jgi:hypothetical protein